MKLFQYLKIKQCSFVLNHINKIEEKSLLSSQEVLTLVIYSTLASALVFSFSLSLHKTFIFTIANITHKKIVLSNSLFYPCSLGQEHRKGFARWLFTAFGFSWGGWDWNINNYIASSFICLLPRFSLVFLSA